MHTSLISMSTKSLVYNLYNLKLAKARQTKQVKYGLNTNITNYISHSTITI